LNTSSSAVAVVVLAVTEQPTAVAAVVLADTEQMQAVKQVAVVPLLNLRLP
jgi:hypothetical protein